MATFSFRRLRQTRSRFCAIPIVTALPTREVSFCKVLRRRNVVGAGQTLLRQQGVGLTHHRFVREMRSQGVSRMESRFNLATFTSATRIVLFAIRTNQA